MDGEFYVESRNPFESYSDRYKNCKILTDIETGETLLSTREISEIPVSVNDKYHRVKSYEVGRLDRIAADYYKNPLMWWVIAQANNIHDPFRAIRIGALLRIPDIETLYGNNGVLL